MTVDTYVQCSCSWTVGLLHGHESARAQLERRNERLRSAPSGQMSHVTDLADRSLPARRWRATWSIAW